MNDVEPSTEETDDFGFRKRALKGFSALEFETAIAKALLELTGQNFDVDLRQLDLNPEPNSFMTDAASMSITLRRKVVRNPNSPF